LLGLGYAYYVVSLNNPERATSARETLDRAYALAEELDDKAAMARARLRTMYFTDFWPDYLPTAQANLREAVELAEETGDEGLVLDAMIAGIAYRLASSGSLEGAYDDLRERLESRRDPLRTKEHYFHGMWLYRGVARFNDAVALCDAAIAIADDLGVPPVMYPTLKALSLLDLGRFDDALASLEREITDEPFGLAFREFGRTHYLYEVKSYEEAAALAVEVASMMASLGRVMMRAVALGVRARSLVAIGGREDEVEEIRAELPPDSRTEVRLARGDAEGALERLERATVRMTKRGERRAAIVAGEAKARALLALGRATEALAETEQWLEMALASEFRPVAWRLHVARAKARKLEGDEPGASEDLVSAAAIVREMAESISDPAQRDRFLSDPEMPSAIRVQA
jgi:tetratricopeptide (TPR) repeat protein